jgi:hypothetical protein
MMQKLVSGKPKNGITSSKSIHLTAFFTVSVGIKVARWVGGVGRSLSCLGNEISLLTASAIAATQKLVSFMPKVA